MSAAAVPARIPVSTMTRGHLSEAVRALAMSLIDPPERWRDLLEPVRAAFTEHCHATEGEQGLYADVVLDAPRLARMVDGLVAEHSQLESAIASLATAVEQTDTDADALRADARKVLDSLALHRQHDSDLVYEAYTTDIGGE
jgi:Hemerythrin HHE cation binding domain